MNDLLKKIVCVTVAVLVICGGTAGFVFAVDESAGAAVLTVKHTEKWEQNRCNYNNRCSAEKLREENVFWPGEKLLVSFHISGDVNSASAHIEGISGAVCDLRPEPEGVYTGVLRDCSGSEKWKKGKQNLTVTAEAHLSDGSVQKSSAVISVDGTEPYWRVHRLY